MISDLQHEVKLLTGKLSTFMSMWWLWKES
jgi:hypothetical protein